MLEPVPMADIRSAIKKSLPGLIASIKGDERNVILTLARMWLTASTGEIRSKDLAAEWAIPQLLYEHANLLDKTRKVYLGEYIDKWNVMESEVTELVNYIRKCIYSDRLECVAVHPPQFHISNSSHADEDFLKPNNHRKDTSRRLEIHFLFLWTRIQRYQS